QQLFGRAAAWIDAVYPEDKSAVMLRWREATQAGRDFAVECRFGTPEGPVRWAAVRVVGGFGTIADVTDKRVAEEALRQNLELLHAVTEGTSDLIVAKDLTGKYLMANSAAARVFGYHQNAIMGRTDSELFSSEIAQGIRSTDYDVALTG